MSRHGWENRHLGITLAKQIFAQCFLEVEWCGYGLVGRGPQAINGAEQSLREANRNICDSLACCLANAHSSPLQGG